jgi:hypothetical protein
VACGSGATSMGPNSASCSELFFSFLFDLLGGSLATEQGFGIGHAVLCLQAAFDLMRPQAVQRFKTDRTQTIHLIAPASQPPTRFILQRAWASRRTM